MATAKKTANDSAEAFAQHVFGPDGLKEGYEKLAKGLSDAAEIQKGAMEALLASAGSLTKGVERAAAEQSAYLKTAYDDGVAVAKATASSKSLQEAVEVQTDFLRSAVEKNLNQLSKMADLWLEASNEASKPLTARYGELIEKVQAYRL